MHRPDYVPADAVYVSSAARPSKLRNVLAVVGWGVFSLIMIVALAVGVALMAGVIARHTLTHPDTTQSTEEPR